MTAARPSRVKGADRDRLREEVVQRYLALENLADLAEDLGHSRHLICALLKEAGVPLRSKVEQSLAGQERRRRADQDLRDQGWPVEDGRTGSRWEAAGNNGSWSRYR